MIKDEDLLLIADDEDFVTSDKFLQHALDCSFCKYGKTDLFWFGGLWRGNRTSSILTSTRAGSRILILGHSDHPVTRAKLLAAKIKGYKFIFGINLNPVLKNTFSLPLGLTNNTDESALHRLLGDTSGIVKSLKSCRRPGTYTHDLYANFTVSNNQDERGTITKVLQEINIGIETPNLSGNGRNDYLKRLRSANFVICPEGNGIDTHRIWETLYVGGTPIVKSNSTMNSLSAALPIVVVEEWEELLNISKLKDQWERIQAHQHSADLLRASYWDSVFSNTHNI